MAIDFITVNRGTTTATHAATLLSLVSAMREAYKQAVQVKAIMTHLNDGTDFTPIEATFGLEAGKGKTVFDLINGTVGSMEGTFQVSDAKMLTERVG